MRRIYCLDDRELARTQQKLAKEKINPEDLTIARFKGLGEMSAADSYTNWKRKVTVHATACSLPNRWLPSCNIWESPERTFHYFPESFVTSRCKRVISQPTKKVN